VPTRAAGINRGKLPLGSEWQPERSLRTIDFERAISGELGQSTGGRARDELHLEEAITCDHEPERAGGVLDGGGEDVRNAAVIVYDVHVPT
jgi:hypothetical protein